MKKIRLNKHGASLAETLVTVLLLVIVLSAVTTGVHAMTTSYYQIRRKANAESLLMTASDIIRGDLRNATEIDGNTDSSRFYCQSRSSVISYQNSNDENNKGIQVLYYNVDDGSSTSKPLVTSKTNTDELYTYIVTPFTYSQETGLITGQIEVRDKSGKSQTGKEPVTITVKPFRFAANAEDSDSGTND